MENIDISQRKINDFRPVLNTIGAAVVVAGALAFALSAQDKHNAFKTEVNTSINVACGQSSGSTAIKKVNFDSERALGIILLKPERLQSVCALVNSALTRAALVKYKFGIPAHDNKDINALGDALGIDSTLATKTVKKTYAANALQHEAGLAKLASTQSFDKKHSRRKHNGRSFIERYCLFAKNGAPRKKPHGDSFIE